MRAEHCEREHLLLTDLVAITAGSFLLLLYLAWAWLSPGEARCAEAAPAGAVRTGSVAAAGARVPADREPAAWVRRRAPVPARVLYPYSEDAGRMAPPPPHEAKPRSWHNRLLFPAVRCPYCGRRVPTRKGSYFWLLIGFVGQLGFSARFLVQWLASERARASVVPTSFWYLSIFGSVFLLVYAVSIVAWPVILGQLPNVFIYGRNLYFIRRVRGRVAGEDAGVSPMSAGERCRETAVKGGSDRRSEPE